MTTEQLEDAEGRALVDAIHERKRADLAVGVDPGAPEATIVFDRATGMIEPPMTMMTRPQDWAPAARAILWPERRRS